MNTAIQAALEHAVQSLQAEGVLPSDWNNTSNLTRTKDRSHGDFASNIAMIDKKKGITTVAHFMGNLGTLPKIIARCFML